MYYELICDERGIHVRPEHIKLAAKCVGVDRLIGITDACEGESDETDVNFVNGEIYGSLLTMDKVAKNLHAVGFTVPEVFMMTSKTPAAVVGIDAVGEIKAGNKADIIVLDPDFSLRRVITSY